MDEGAVELGPLGLERRARGHQPDHSGKAPSGRRAGRAGVSVSLARNAEKEKAADNPQPFLHEMTRSGLDQTQFSLDRYSVSYHGYAHTHMDSLCHMFHDGKMFNGYRADRR